MEAVKSSPNPASQSTQALQATEASKRAERKDKSEAQAQAVASKKAEEQTPPRATVNTRGEMIGRLLNVRA